MNTNIVTENILSDIDKTHINLANLLRYADNNPAVSIKNIFSSLSDIKYIYYQILFIRNKCIPVKKSNICFNHTIFEFLKNIGYNMSETNPFDNMSHFTESITMTLVYMKSVLYSEIENNLTLIRNSFPDYNKKLTDKIFSDFISHVHDFRTFSENDISDTDNPGCVNIFLNYLCYIQHNSTDQSIRRYLLDLKPENNTVYSLIIPDFCEKDDPFEFIFITRRSLDSMACLLKDSIANSIELIQSDNEININIQKLK